jgi:hypothetical protein
MFRGGIVACDRIQDGSNSVPPANPKISSDRTRMQRFAFSASYRTGGGCSELPPSQEGLAATRAAKHNTVAREQQQWSNAAPR